MYSPKIKETYIPKLYRFARSINKPMTYVVNEAIKNYLKNNQEKGNNDSRRSVK